jgi:hypothetical protein
MRRVCASAVVRLADALLDNDHAEAEHVGSMARAIATCHTGSHIMRWLAVSCDRAVSMARAAARTPQAVTFGRHLKPVIAASGTSGRQTPP